MYAIMSSIYEKMGSVILIGLTLKITPEMIISPQGSGKKANAGHPGTHFDVMDKDFCVGIFRNKKCYFWVSAGF